MRSPDEPSKSALLQLHRHLDWINCEAVSTVFGQKGFRVRMVEMVESRLRLFFEVEWDERTAQEILYQLKRIIRLYGGELCSSGFAWSKSLEPVSSIYDASPAWFARRTTMLEIKADIQLPRRRRYEDLALRSKSHTIRLY